MSALPLKADTVQDARDVRFVPLADTGSAYFDHLVSQDRERLLKAKPARIREGAAE
jgi:hypothetical protein